MRRTDTRQREPDPGPVLSGLAVDQRRRILSILRGGGSISEAELARRLAASSDADPRPVAGSRETSQVRTELHHVHLPKLAEVGLVDWDEERSTVALADHDAFESDAIWELVAADSDVDDVLACLADACNREVLEILDDAGGQIHRARLAATLVDCAPDVEVGDVDLGRVLLTLRHGHLPRLAAAGLVEVDGETIEATDDDRLATVWPVVAALSGRRTHDGVP